MILIEIVWQENGNGRRRIHQRFLFMMTNKFSFIREEVHRHKSFSLIDHYLPMDNFIGKFSCQPFMELRLCLVLPVSEWKFEKDWKRRTNCRSLLANQQKLISENFLDLIGSDEHGWGLSHHGLLWHNGISHPYLKKPFDLLKPVLVGLHFDADGRTLSYTINNQPMGIAFHSIPRNLPIYPAVSSTSAQSTMILKHSCQICSSLREICLRTIKSIGLIQPINPQILPAHLIKTVT